METVIFHIFDVSLMRLAQHPCNSRMLLAYEVINGNDEKFRKSIRWYQGRKFLDIDHV